MEKSLPVVNGSYSSKEQYLTNINLCETKNKGLELALNTRNIETKNFQWTSALTFAYNKEEITKLTGTANDKVINGDYTYAVGSAINSFITTNWMVSGRKVKKLMLLCLD